MDNFKKSISKSTANSNSKSFVNPHLTFYLRKFAKAKQESCGNANHWRECSTFKYWILGYILIGGGKYQENKIKKRIGALNKIIQERDEELSDLKMALDMMGYKKDPNKATMTREKICKNLKKINEGMIPKKGLILSRVRRILIILGKES